MPTTVVKQIYFGKFQDLDPVEASPTAGNYNNDWNELQTVPGWGPGVTFKHSALRLMDIAQNDTVRQSQSNRLEENDFKNATTSNGGPGPIGADSITYNLGNGSVTSEIDSTFRWNLELTLIDGSKVMKSATFIQLVDGSIFSNFDNADFANLKITAIKLVSFGDDKFYGATGKRSLNSVQLLCFTADARIRTPAGEVPAVDLQIGDLVTTLDHGPQPVRWTTKRQITRAEMARDPSLAPVGISAGALGPGLPAAPLVLSPQHRVLVRSPIIMRMFGQDEVLVAVKHLLGYPGIEVVDDLPCVTYVHLALTRHEIVYANSLPAESLFPGKMVLEPVGDDDRTGLHELYAQRDVPPARYFATRSEAKALVRRHLKNRRSLLQVDGFV